MLIALAILAFLGSVGASSFITQLFTRKKTAAEAAQIITQAATSMLGELQKQIVGLREEIHQLREEVWRLGGNPNAIGERPRIAPTPHVTVINQPAATPAEPIPHLELP